MYAANRSHDAANPGSHRPDESWGRERFRPVALPALAAAMHIHSAAARSARDKLAARRIAPIVHEDEPSL